MKKVTLNPLVIALDVDTRERALELADMTGEVAGAFKIGPRLIYRYGQSLVQELKKFAPVFIDCKFFDIPSTMEAAVRTCFESGASICTVHALAGNEALKRLADLEQKLNEERPFQILAVTVLTSWGADSFPTNLKTQSVGEHVLALASQASDAGITGLVCSGEELDLLEKENKFSSMFKLVPGVRFADDVAGDQKRIISPGTAIKRGATAIVVGRPIVEHADPRQSALDFSCALFNAK